MDAIAATVEDGKGGRDNTDPEVEIGIETGTVFSGRIYLDKLTTLSREGMEVLARGEGCLVFELISCFFIFSLSPIFPVSFVSSPRTLKVAISSKFTGFEEGIGRVREVGADEEDKEVFRFV